MAAFLVTEGQGRGRVDMHVGLGWELDRCNENMILCWRAALLGTTGFATASFVPDTRHTCQTV